ncbi:MAG: hypothetical protein N2110_09575 [Flavobacteriales bacterium]|nr:hypothetical protein [Flavobacteriales bacterium]
MPPAPKGSGCTGFRVRSGTALPTGFRPVGKAVPASGRPPHPSPITGPPLLSRPAHPSPTYYIPH